MLRWLRLFRVVNLPTVPGDVFVGAAAVLASGGGLSPVWWAAAASVFIYMFGLVHNDIVGAKTDKGRPIADGEISMDSAWAAAAACLGAAAFCAYLGGLFRGGFLSHGSWLAHALLLVALVVVYNRTKQWWVMGACRGLNVLLGASAVCASAGRACAFELRLASFAVVWWLYISLVTLYSKGEEDDPAKKRRVGFLVGAIVYLQLVALIVMTLAYPRVAGIRTLLVAGAAMLILLRLSTRLLPKVSAS